MNKDRQVAAVGAQNLQVSSAKPSRRRFFQQLSGVTAAAVAANAAAPLLDNSSLTQVQAAALGPLDGSTRLRSATLRRQTAAYSNSLAPIQSHFTNGDEETYSNKFASFSKSFPHNNLGEVDLSAYGTYLNALVSGRHADFEAIPAGGTVKLVNPQAGLCYDLEGTDIQSFAITAPPKFNSEQIAGEIVELYWRALTRDIAFSQYGSNGMISDAMNDLRLFSDYSGVGAQNLFRTPMPGDSSGYFVSQFLLKPYSLGATSIDQKYRLPVANEDFMTNYQEWLDIQNGKAPVRKITFDSTPRYIRNGRDLGEYVHSDYSYQAFLNAALIANSFGGAALDDANPYKRATRQAGFATFGGPHLVDLVARVAALALKGAWFQKWYVHRRIRPEEFAGRIHNKMLRTADYPMHGKLFTSSALARIFSKYGTYLLPMAFAEGCPIHPAMPGGHATIAGACTTVLKALFDENFVIPSPVVPTDDGAQLQAYNGTLTLGGELNKLASNMSYGRDTAGMHWRTDEVEGLKLGEAIAISVLNDFNGCFNESFAGFSLTKFDGTRITLSGGLRSSGRTIRRL